MLRASRALKRATVAAIFNQLLVQEILIVTRCAGIDIQSVKPVVPRGFSRATTHRTFEKSAEWLEMRERALTKYGKVCKQCGAVDGLQVDHIKPKSRHPHLALEIDNLQVLCWPCNRTKGTREVVLTAKL